MDLLTHACAGVALSPFTPLTPLTGLDGQYTLITPGLMPIRPAVRNDPR